MPYLSGEEMNDLEGVLHDADGHQLLAVVASMHHQRRREALDDWALCFTETFHLVATGRMRQILGVLLFDGNVILKHIQNQAK